METNLFSLKTFLFILVIFSGCTTVPSDIDVTLDTAQNGMIKGAVLTPIVNKNSIEWVGLKDCIISLENTDYTVKTLIDGIYAIDGIKTGSYKVKATASKYESDTKSVIVTRQAISTVPDLHLIPNILNPIPLIFYGKVYEKDKSTPFSNKKIYLRVAAKNITTGEIIPGSSVSSTTTSSKGEFAFPIQGSNSYMLYYNSEIIIRFMNPDSPICTLPISGLVERNAYLK